MRRSEQVTQTLLRFYEVFSTADLEGLSRLIADEDEGILVIGTDPGDWVEGRERWVAVREAMQGTMWEGVKLEAVKLEAVRSPPGMKRAHSAVSPTDQWSGWQAALPSPRA